MSDEQRRWDDAIRDHERRKHHPPMEELFPGANPEEIVRNVVSMSDAMPGLLDVVYGPPRLDPVTGNPIRLSDGSVLRWEDKGLRHQLSNGGVRASVHWTRTQWVAILTIGISVILRLFGVEIPL